MIGSELCQELIVGNPSGRREAGFRTYPSPYLDGDFRCRLDSLPILGDVKRGFIQAAILKVGRGGVSFDFLNFQQFGWDGERGEGLEEDGPGGKDCIG